MAAFFRTSLLLAVVAIVQGTAALAETRFLIVSDCESALTNAHQVKRDELIEKGDTKSEFVAAIQSGNLVEAQRLLNENAFKLFPEFRNTLQADGSALLVGRDGFTKGIEISSVSALRAFGVDSPESVEFLKIRLRNADFSTSPFLPFSTKTSVKNLTLDVVSLDFAKATGTLNLFYTDSTSRGRAIRLFFSRLRTLVVNGTKFFPKRLRTTLTMPDLVSLDLSGSVGLEFAPEYFTAENLTTLRIDRSAMLGSIPTGLNTIFRAWPKLTHLSARNLNQAIPYSRELWNNTPREIQQILETHREWIEGDELTTLKRLCGIE